MTRIVQRYRFNRSLITASQYDVPCNIILYNKNAWQQDEKIKIIYWLLKQKHKQAYVNQSWDSKTWTSKL